MKRVSSCLTIILQGYSIQFENFEENSLNFKSSCFELVSLTEGTFIPSQVPVQPLGLRVPSSKWSGESKIKITLIQEPVSGCSQWLFLSSTQSGNTLNVPQEWYPPRGEIGFMCPMVQTGDNARQHRQILNTACWTEKPACYVNSCTWYS